MKKEDKIFVVIALIGFIAFGLFMMAITEKTDNNWQQSKQLCKESSVGHGCISTITKSSGIFRSGQCWCVKEGETKRIW